MNQSVCWKVAYSVCRSSDLFSLPVLRQIRNSVYAKRFSATGINVDSFVRMKAAHRNPTNRIEIGIGVGIGYGAYIDYSGGVQIQDRVAISDGCKIFTHNHPVLAGHQDWRKNPIEFVELVIGANAWLGANCIVLHNVSKIGVGAIVAAGAVVTKNVEDHTIVAGNPAKQIGVRDVGHAGKLDSPDAI